MVTTKTLVVEILAYAGITTVISSEISSATTEDIDIRNVNDFNLQIGDYLRIDDEIVRIKTTVTYNPVKVFRGLMGTRPTTHEDENVIKKIDVANQLNSEETPSFVLLVIHLNILVMDLVTTPQLFHKDRRNNLLLRNN